MTPQDIKIINSWAADLQVPLRLSLLPAPQDPTAAYFTEFCDRLKALVPTLSIQKASDAPFPGPALMIGRDANIVYRAIPQGLELGPFLEALSPARNDRVAPETLRILEGLDLPLLLSLYISPHCPHCPVVARRLLDMASASPKIRLTVIDGELFAAEARREQIRSVPTLILDGQFRWTGQIDLHEMLEMAVHRDPIRTSALSLRQMLESGGAEQAAQMMVKYNAVFPALLELLLDPRWSVRLGAMVTVEYLAEAAPVLAAGLIDPLGERFAGLPSQVQGDVVQVLGQIGARQHLERIVAGPFAEDVKRAAAEELQSSPE